ncbi:C6 transcription factor [Phlyctema vagabunda]|uniref:C6 transcription factor n=1 Tax=Phlyctema vagabunda TaxID=108571 RepID=A0ABR4PKH9_9HELO
MSPQQTIIQPGPDVDMSWSETTTPDYDEIEEITRQTPSRLSAPPEHRVRIMREPIKKRRRIDEIPRGSWQSRAFHEFGQPLHLRCSMDGSDGSNSSALTIVTSASSSCGDPWSASGIVGDDADDHHPGWSRNRGGREDHHDEGDDEKDNDAEDNVFLLPKMEPGEDEVNLAEMKEASVPTSPGEPRQLKRPRGRPRKYPKQTAESMAKVAKGRSKTGCKTCRKRKKKCDEAKPHCMNCEKNNVKCEGYPEMTIWKSGKEKKAEEGTAIWTQQDRPTGELIPSTARMRRVNIPTIQLKSVLHGVDTDGDRLFFHHYIYKLSCIFTVEGEQKNAFKDMMLPLAVRHQGLMHSILALAGRHIDFRSNYGVKLLQDHPNVKEVELQERSDYHKQEAMKLFLSDCESTESDQEDYVTSARFGQMICMVMDTLSNPDPRGDHRIHLKAYQRLIQERPPSDQDFLGFIKEFFDYHISMDDLIFFPELSSIDFSITTTPNPMPSIDMDFHIPKSGFRMLGVCDGLAHLFSHITSMRNEIRVNIAQNKDLVVDYQHLWRASEIDAAIRSWEPALALDDPAYPAALLYKQMAWVYLFRTIHVHATSPHERLKQTVDEGLRILSSIPASHQTQTLLLSPTFALGCAAYEESQRAQVRKSIAVIKDYMQYRNSDSALEVLEETWRLMDAGDLRGWDWQMIARGMGRDFLAT